MLTGQLERAMSVPVGSDPLQACCSSQIYLAFIQTLKMSSNISNPIWLGWTRTGEDTEPYQDSQPLKFEDWSPTALRTDGPLLDLKLFSSLVPRLLHFIGLFEAKIK